jgi:hypothetical protein
MLNGMGVRKLAMLGGLFTKAEDCALAIIELGSE